MLKPPVPSLEKCASHLKEKIHFFPISLFVFIFNIIEKIS